VLGRVIAVVVVVASLVAIAVVVFRPGYIVAGESSEYASSLARSSDREGGGACTRQRGRGWYWCVVGSGDGAAHFRLVETGNGCWEAGRVRIRTRGRSPRGVDVVPARGDDDLSGCIGLIDYAFPSHASDGHEAGQLPLRSG
jgi:hypothetical protein